MIPTPGVLLPLALASLCGAQQVEFKRVCLTDLVKHIPQILSSQDKSSGRFGKGIWIVTDQNVLLPLAAAWSYKDSANPYYRSPELLAGIMAGGDALIDDQDEEGKWEFRKKDGSTWGKIYMPWTYSRWIRAYALIRDAMPRERRERWERALRLGFAGIARDLEKARVQNIPAHHAMGLYFAAKAFDNADWERIARDFLRMVAAAQHSDGYWSEHTGPVVLYGFVYVDALGTYYAVSHDPKVLPALEKVALFHARFTYPDGSDIETIDERNPYHPGVRLPNVGFTFSAAGRSYLLRQLRLLGSKGLISPDEAASLLLWGQEGPGMEQQDADFDYVLPSGDAAIRKRGPWFLVVSALTAQLSTSRWIQDRQNFFSVFHAQTGLILGGGNTKLQPRWSTFTAGDIALLRHRSGDETPDFRAPPGLVHIPERAKLLDRGRFGVKLWYGALAAEVSFEVRGQDRLEIRLAADPRLNAHATILPRFGQPVSSAQGSQATLDPSPWEWRPEDAGEWLEHGGLRLSYPRGSSIHWPVLPHDPYKKDGSAGPQQGRIVLDIPAGEPANIVVTVLRGSSP